jgi:hypothetical protein
MENEIEVLRNRVAALEQKAAAPKSTLIMKLVESTIVDSDNDPCALLDYCVGCTFCTVLLFMIIIGL